MVRACVHDARVGFAICIEQPTANLVVSALEQSGIVEGRKGESNGLICKLMIPNHDLTWRNDGRRCHQLVAASSKH